MDFQTISKTTIKIVFAFVEVTIVGFFSLFFIVGYSQYLSLKEFFYSKIKMKVEEVFFTLKLFIEGRFRFDLVPYSVKRRFIELLPESELHEFRKTSRNNAKLVQSLRGPVIEEICFELGEIWETCKLQKDRDCPCMGTLIIPSNLVSPNLGCFKVFKNLKRLGIMGTATSRDYLVDKVVNVLPEGISVDWFFVDIDVGQIGKLKKLIDQVNPRKLSMSLGLEDSNCSLDQVLDVIGEKIEEIE